MAELTGVGTSQNNDPENRMLHRVPSPMLARYKADVVKNVTALCGKKWAPTFPIRRMSSMPRCPGCFPPEPDRYSIAN